VLLCEYIIEHLRNNVDCEFNLGIPGITDNRRSGAFRRCVYKPTNWRVADEHYGQYQFLDGADGAGLITNHYSEVHYVNNANTAIRIGVLTVIEILPSDKKPLISG